MGSSQRRALDNWHQGAVGLVQAGHMIIIFLRILQLGRNRAKLNACTKNDAEY